MKYSVSVILLCLCIQSANAMGLFRKHHSDYSPPPHTDPAVIPPIPEPETYVFIGVGVAAVIWLARRKKK